MLQDVIELRMKNWVPRAIVVQSNPKTMDQIQNEMELEQVIIFLFDNIQPNWTWQYADFDYHIYHNLLILQSSCLFFRWKSPLYFIAKWVKVC